MAVLAGWVGASPAETSLALAAQSSPPRDAGIHRTLDEILDLYVRDGQVYYRALKTERGRIDRYAASLNVPTELYERWSRDEKLAFWINAYNVFVLQTVINQYPIDGRAPNYPRDSIRQIAGAFDRIPHRAAGRRVTLDEIEETILPEFGDPRAYLALGRGAVGSPRLRSEAYTAGRLESQLSGAVEEFATRTRLTRIDTLANVIEVTPVVSWRADEFSNAYGQTGNGGSPFGARSPIERAIIALITPHLLPMERQFLLKNEFQVRFGEFDWRLNDLTGGRRD